MRLLKPKKVSLVGVGLLLGLLLVLPAAGDSQSVSVQAVSYLDAIRFIAQGAKVAQMRLELFNLAGQKLYDSDFLGQTTLDWHLVNEWGDKVADGVYLYVVSLKDDKGMLLGRKLGKVVVSKGRGSVAPPLGEPLVSLPGVSQLGVARAVPLGGPDFGSATISGGHVSVTPSFSAAGIWAILDGSFPQLVFGDSGTTYVTLQWFSSADYGLLQTYINGVASGPLALQAGGGNVGIGYSNPIARTHINNTANQPALRIDSSAGTNALEIYNTGSGSATGLIFRVERATGNVYADGSFNGAAFNSGVGADITERIDTTEPVEPGDVVEIDPNNPGKFRKAREAMSTRVAGVISTKPAITLGNNFDGSKEQWNDDRPLLALAGRVPVKAIAKFGAIEIGDLLVSSPIPGYAMKCPEASQCIGAIIGKAIEPLKEGVGKIEVQVMLR